MTIDNIKGNNYSPKKSDKSSSSPKAKQANSGSGPSKSNSAKLSGQAAKLSLSGSTFENEIAFTQKILGNTRQESFASLNKIKQKINTGAYNSEEVHKKVGSLISKDIISLQDIFAKPASPEKTPLSLSKVHKRNLLENPEITRKVADKIADDLRNL